MVVNVTHEVFQIVSQPIRLGLKLEMLLYVDVGLPKDHTRYDLEFILGKGLQMLYVGWFALEQVKHELSHPLQILVMRRIHVG